MVITALYILLTSFSGLNPLSYFPQGGNVYPNNQADTIKIGLLIQDKKSTAAVHGAEMAINKSNLVTTRSGRYFKLEVRNMEGPWGTGARETVSLVFGEDVWAVIGSVDGRNSHLAEQVSAKTHVPYISALSGDPTLAQAFIPWYFSCVPNDLQQADCILQHIRGKGKSRIMIISENGYDPKMASASFIKRARINDLPEPVCYYADDPASPDIIDKIRKEDPECLVIFGSRNPVIELAGVTGKMNINADIFCSLMPAGEEEIPDDGLKKLEGVNLVSPGYLFNLAGKSFIEEYEKKFRIKPVPAAAYAYDAVSVAIEGIRKAGDDRIRLRDCIMALKLEGLTGMISFDRNGNRADKPSLMKIEDGQPVPIR